MRLSFYNCFACPRLYRTIVSVIATIPVMKGCRRSETLAAGRAMVCHGRRLAGRFGSRQRAILRRQRPPQRQHDKKREESGKEQRNRLPIFSEEH